MMRIIHRNRLLSLILLCLGITGCSQNAIVSDQTTAESGYTEEYNVYDEDNNYDINSSDEDNTESKDNESSYSDKNNNIDEDKNIGSTVKDDTKLEGNEIDTQITGIATPSTIEEESSGINNTTTPTQEPTQSAEQIPDITFDKTSGLVYATSNVNIRSSYTTKADNIITVLKEGTSIERIGIHEEWSEVLYQDEVCYIKTDYLTDSKPTREDPPVVTNNDNDTEITEGGSSEPQQPTKEPSALKESFVTDLSIASDISQLVVVVGNGGSDAVVSYHVKDNTGKWQEEFSVDGDVGTKGISYNKKEGDSKTPAGVYSFTLSFGIKSDPGAKLPYRRITEYDYWVDDGESPYYNTWVNSKETPGDFRSEHLIEHNPSYNYAMSINYNPNNTPGLGSAIFLHCYNGSGRTTGCIAIAEKYMKLLVQELEPSAKILVVPSIEDLANY